MEPSISSPTPIRVLVVEDELLISDLIAEALSEEGFAVHTATNAEDAIRHLAWMPVDVLFTDINLAGAMDGVALARRGRDLLPHLCVVYTSARSSMLDPKMQVPGSIFVPKPYLPSLIGRLLAHAVLKSARQPVPA